LTSSAAIADDAWIKVSENAKASYSFQFHSCYISTYVDAAGAPYVYCVEQIFNKVSNTSTYGTVEAAISYCKQRYGVLTSRDGEKNITERDNVATDGQSVASLEFTFICGEADYINANTNKPAAPTAPTAPTKQADYL
jgi:hypothetical protein